MNEDEATFNMSKSMKHPSDIPVVTTIYVVDEIVAILSHLMCRREQL